MSLPHLNSPPKWVGALCSEENLFLPLFTKILLLFRFHLRPNLRLKPHLITPFLDSIKLLRLVNLRERSKHFKISIRKMLTHITSFIFTLNLLHSRHLNNLIPHMLIHNHIRRRHKQLLQQLSIYLQLLSLRLCKNILHILPMHYFLFLLSQLCLGIIVKVITINLITLIKARCSMLWVVVPFHARYGVYYAVCVALKFHALKAE